MREDKINKINLNILFEGNEITKQLDIARCQFLEELLKIFVKVMCIFLLFLLVNKFGEYLTEQNVLQQSGFNSDVLFSVFVLPLLYSLKDVRDCFGSLFVKVWQDETSITVKRGLFWNKYDKLYLKDLNNIELYQSLCGKIWKYCSLDLYAVGGILSIPYLKYTNKNKKVVSELMEKASKN